MKKTLYSPNQILAAAFIGGPLAALAALKLNFDALDNPHGAHLVIRWGVAFLIVLLSTLPFLPPDFPQIVVPLSYSLVAKTIADKFQLSRERIAEDERYDFIPANRLVLHSLLWMMAFLLVSIVWLGGLSEFGLIQLPEPPVVPPDTGTAPVAP